MSVRADLWQGVQCDGGGFAVFSNQIKRVGGRCPHEEMRRFIARRTRRLVFVCARYDSVCGDNDPDSLLGDQVGGDQLPDAFSALLEIYDLCAASVTVGGLHAQ